MTQKKQVGDLGGTAEVVVLGVVLIGGYFGVVKPLMSMFGASPADVAAVNDQISMPAAANPFSALFQPSVDFYNSHPGKDADGNPLPIQQAFQAIKAAYDSGNLQTLAVSDPSYADMFTVAQIAEKLNDIYFWQFLKGYSADDVISLFAQIRSQDMLSELSQYMLYNFNVDLLPGLRGGVLKFGLNDTQLSQLISQMTNLPLQ